MTTDTSGPQFSLGAFNYTQIKAESGVYLFQVTSCYNYPTDPGQGWAVVQKKIFNWNMPTDAMNNFPLSQDQNAEAELLFDTLVKASPANRPGLGMGCIHDLRRIRAQKPVILPMLF